RARDDPRRPHLLQRAKRPGGRRLGARHRRAVRLSALHLPGQGAARRRPGSRDGGTDGHQSGPAHRAHHRHRLGARRHGGRAARAGARAIAVRRRHGDRQGVRHRHHRRLRQPAGHDHRRHSRRHHRGVHGPVPGLRPHRPGRLRPPARDAGLAAHGPDRGTQRGKRLRRAAYAVAALAVIAALPWLITTPYWRGILVLCAMNVLLALSLNLVMGYTGQLNLGQSAFFAIGAYASTILVKTYGWNFWLASLAAIAGAGFLGLALAAFAVRLRGHYLAIASLGFAVITYQVLFNWERVTEGVRGFYGIVPPVRNAVAPFSLIGAIMLTFLPELLRGFGELRLMIYGAALTLVVLFMPGGMVQAWTTLRARVR